MSKQMKIRFFGDLKTGDKFFLNGEKHGYTQIKDMLCVKIDETTANEIDENQNLIQILKLDKLNTVIS